MSKKTEALLGRLKTALETEADKDAAREGARVQAIVRDLCRPRGGSPQPVTAP